MLKKINYKLRIAGTKIGLDLPYFVKNGFWLSLGHGVDTIKGVVLSVVFTNFLSKSIYGEYNLYLSILGILTIFALPGMNQSIIQAVSRGYDGTYFKAIITKAKWSILGTIALIGIAIYFYFFKSDAQISISLIMLAVIFPLYAISETYQEFFAGKKKFRQLVIVSSIFGIFSMIGLTAVVFLYPSALLLLLVTVFIQIIILGGFSLIAMRKYITNNKVDKSNIIFGKKLSLIGVLDVIANHIDKLIIGIFIGGVDLAIYQVAIMLPDYLKTSFAPITRTFLPKLSNMKIDINNKDELKKNFFKMFIPVAAMIIIFLITAPFVFKYVFPKYLDQSLTFALVYSLSILASPLVIFHSYFVSAKKTKPIFYLKISFSLIIVILSPILIYYFHIWGAIITRIIARTVALIVSYVCYERSFEKK
ncbi:oligosaccharide flippase family protein [Patescibacteria group bacterium]|nr:oligosaccharide flippase family protein [Patescibacteria group bacterium]